MDPKTEKRLQRMENKIDFLIKELVSYNEKGNIDLNQFEPPEIDRPDIWDKVKADKIEKLTEKAWDNAPGDDTFEVN